MINILDLQIYLPILLGGLLLVLKPLKQASVAKVYSLFSVMGTLGISLAMLVNFDSKAVGMSWVESHQWLNMLGVRYSLGVDGISVLMILLSVFTNLIVVICTWDSINKQVHIYHALLLILQGLLVGVFAATDAILFYIFWEATLVPMYLMIGIWGSANRMYAAVKFFLYTFFGSVLMLAAILYMGYEQGSFDIASFYQLKLTMRAQTLILIAFFFGFAIKVPMFPVHTWLPDAHTEAPAGGSIILAAILLKLGAYGFIRFMLPIVPDACRTYANYLVVLSLIAVVYIGLIAVIQKDMKKLIAYSSISHMGFVTLGCFGIYYVVSPGDYTQAGLLLEGAIVIMISHAFVSSGLFASVGSIYDRLHTRDINSMGGLVHRMPMFATFFMIFAMANAGLPGTSGFVGEFMIILGAMSAGFWISFIAAITLILGASYTLWMYKRVIFGSINSKKIAEINDVTSAEKIGLGLLGLMVLIMGIYPNPLLNYLHSSVQQTIKYAVKTKLI